MNKKPVNVNWQILFVFIPFVWIWAFYRIDKLWKGLALMFGVGFAVALVVVFFVGFGEGIMGVPGEEVSQEGENLSAILSYAIIAGVGIHYMRKWSKEWNEKVAVNG